MELGQAEFVRVFYYQCIDIRNVYSGFDNRCTDKHLDIAAYHAVHHFLQCLLVHLAVGNRNGYRRSELFFSLRAVLSISSIRL